MPLPIERSFTRYDVTDHIARLTLNRPDKKNALNRQMRWEVQQSFLDMKTNPDVWLAIIDAEGDVFCSGKDLTETIDPMTDDGTVLSNDDLFSYQRTIYKPIIVAVQGPCFAQGAGFSLSSDIVIMTENASIGWPQVSRGISSVSGPTQGAHAMPWAIAMGYLLRAKPIPASEAFRFGLCNEVVPQDKKALLDAADRWAGEILQNAPLALQGVKEAGRRCEDLSLEQRFRLARDIADRVLKSEDSKEGILAFREKRKPAWKGR
jgi:E-phenylitaconyl-CoA hydratase